MTNPWREAMIFYRRWFGWTGWEHGMLRPGRRGYWRTYPRWFDTAEHRVIWAWRRLTGRCPQCRMPHPQERRAHKPDCSWWGAHRAGAR